MARRKTFPTAAIVLLASCLAGGLAGAMLGSPREPPAGGFSETRVVLPDVVLVDQDGAARAFRSDIAAGAWLVITFNYTTCESICPLGNEMMKAIDREAPARVGKPLRLLSITIDPREDTPAKLREAAAAFAPSSRWRWLTGTPEEVDRVLRSFGAGEPDIALHAPGFLIGDPESGVFLTTNTLPDVSTVLAAIERLQG